MLRTLTQSAVALTIAAGCLAWAHGASAQAPHAATIYIEPSDDGFHTFIAAAMMKKKVPANVAERPDIATHTLKASAIEVQKETTGSKVVKCLFLYCADTLDKASTSVQLVDHSGIVVWSYAVNKGRGAKNRQSMAEAIAKHLKDEYFRR